MYESHLHTATEQLDNVIKDLNNVLVVKREINEKKEKVFFPELIENIKSSIQNIVEKDHVKIITDFSAVDSITTLKGHLYSIFYNLISNSIKYSRPGVAPVIKVTSEKKGKHVLLRFMDNGIGIDLEQHRDSVFGLYKRFHFEVEGKGMGLFMTKTQVETLGGKISISSEVNKGTEFMIELEP
jgi:signal transduction histidine kinase